MVSILFTTCDTWPNLSQSDEMVATALQALGHDVQPARWQGSFVSFQRADLIISRAHWDYHYDMVGFIAWLDRLEAEALPVYNPVELMRWNLEKRYLLDLQARGVTVPVTAVLGVNDDPLAIYAQHGWEGAVIKPMAGASGYLVERVPAVD